MSSPRRQLQSRDSDSEDYTSSSYATTTSGSSSKKSKRGESYSTRYENEVTDVTPTHLKTTFGIPSLRTDYQKTEKSVGLLPHPEYVSGTLDGQPLVWSPKSAETTRSQIPTFVRRETYEATTYDDDKNDSSSSESKDETRIAITERSTTKTPNANPTAREEDVKTATTYYPKSDHSSSSNSSSSESRNHNDFTTKTYVLEKPPRIELGDVRSREITPEERLLYYERKFEEIEKRRSLSRTPDSMVYLNRSPSSTSSSTSSTPLESMLPHHKIEFNSNDSERNIDDEVKARSFGKIQLNNDDKREEIGLATIPSDSLPQNVKPLAAGVKSSRPSVTEPVYSQVEKPPVKPMRPYNQGGRQGRPEHVPPKKILDDEGPPVDTKTLEREKREACAKSPKKDSKKFSFSFGKSKKPKIKRQISGPVGEVVHCSGSSDRDLIRNYGVGIYDEGARITDGDKGEPVLPEVHEVGTQPSHWEVTTEPTIIQQRLPPFEEPQILTPTDSFARSTEPTKPRKPHKPKIARKAQRSKAKNQSYPINRGSSPESEDDIQTDPTIHHSVYHPTSMFGSGNAPLQKPIPPPLLDPEYELGPPLGFQDPQEQFPLPEDIRVPSPPVKQPRKRVVINEPRKVQRVEPQKRELRRLSKEEISLPVGDPVQQKGRSSPELMEAYGVRTPVRVDAEEADNAFIKLEDNRIVRRDSILDLKGEKPRVRERRSRPKEEVKEEPQERKTQTDPPKQQPNRSDVYLDFMMAEIPGLEGVDNSVINEYINTLISLTPEPQLGATAIPPPATENAVKDNFVEDYISHMQAEQRKRGVKPNEPNFFDPEVINNFRKLGEGLQPKPVSKPKVKRKTSKDVFLERRASIGSFLADPKNRKEGFTYLTMDKEAGPWFKGHGQQDKNISKDDLIAGHRQGVRKDPRFPDYPVGGTLPVQRSHNTKFLSDHLQRRLSLGNSPPRSNTLPANLEKKRKERTPRRVQRSHSSVQQGSVPPPPKQPLRRRHSSAGDHSRRRGGGRRDNITPRRHEDITYDSHGPVGIPDDPTTYDSHGAVPVRKPYYELRKPVAVDHKSQKQPRNHKKKKNKTSEQKQMLPVTETNSDRVRERKAKPKADTSESEYQLLMVKKKHMYGVPPDYRDAQRRSRARPDVR